ncbi:MAG: metalloprotease PmbA [Gammaproteobacteria bacterium]|nr:metalloprotease PmbA [Gammaproteobacteria bacterium]MCP5200460.1 metalloprotease PmbA [Gammaproteobacteria bacterium]
MACDALEIATASGVGEAEIAVSAGEGLSVTVRDGACETLEYERDKSLAVTVYLDGRKGSATTTDFSRAALEDTIAAARRIAEHGEADPYAGLAEARYLATNVPDLDLDHPWELSAEEAIALALDCERVALGEDKRIRQSDGASVNRYRGTRAYANSHGFHGAYRGTRHAVSAVMIGADDGGMQRGYWYSSARDPARLEDPAAVGRRAAERTVAKLGARRIATTTLPVIFEHRAAAGLIGHLVSAISGGAQYRRASFLLDALGEAVLAPALSLDERPHLPGALGSAPFDGDGIATREQTIVHAGRLETYLLGAYAARRLRREPTGNAGGTHNLVLVGATQPLEAIVGRLERGLLVTDLMGFGVNGVTGDYSRGASGFYIENGEIAYPVEEITIAGKLREMLCGITAVADDALEDMSIHTGSLLVERMAVAGS